MPRERVITYIDGFNLYYGLRAAGFHSSRWLDVVALSHRLLKSGQQLEKVRYFTARVRGNPSAESRQAIYIDALGAVGGVFEIDYGFFLSKQVKCYRCNHHRFTHEEKKTDVNMAVRLLEDAYDNLYDIAIVVSGDSDLAPPVRAVLRRFPKKQIIVASPPKRHSKELEKYATATIAITRMAIRRSSLPSPVITDEGIELHAPPGWLPEA